MNMLLSKFEQGLILRLLDNKACTPNEKKNLSRRLKDHKDCSKSKYFREKAKKQWNRDGEIEIDQNATVSMSDSGGAYVMAWVWVYDDNTKRKCNNE